MQRIWRPCLIAAALVALTGCMNRSAPPAATPAPPPPDIAGRWTLSAAPGGACAMNFAAPAQGAEGTIRPEGGCPGNFYTSRRWSFEGGELMIRDHNSTPLAKLRLAGPGRYEGQTASGQPLSLVR